MLATTDIEFPSTAISLLSQKKAVPKKLALDLHAAFGAWCGV